MKIQEVSLTPAMRIVRDYLKEGKFIRVIQDYSTNDVDRIITDEDGNDTMSINHSTMKALVRRGVIKQRPTIQPCLQLYFEEWVLAK